MSAPEWFEFRDTDIAGLRTVERRRLADSRGYLGRLFCADAFTHAGFDRPVAQINQTLTRRCGTVRGLHYQRPPFAETKLVTCVRGEVWDVAVDLRPGSPTFRRWYGELLSADNCRSLLIPEGFAHGFQTLADECELIYLHSRPYNAQSEGAVNAVDPAIGVAWPLAIVERSARDMDHPMLPTSFAGIA